MLFSKSRPAYPWRRGAAEFEGAVGGVGVLSTKGLEAGEAGEPEERSSLRYSTQHVGGISIAAHSAPVQVHEERSTTQHGPFVFHSSNPRTSSRPACNIQLGVKAHLCHHTFVVVNPIYVRIRCSVCMWGALF